MLKSPLAPRLGELVVGVLADVLKNGQPLDRAYSRHFAGKKLQPREQARVTLVTGDLLRRLNLYARLAGCELSAAADNGWPLLLAWHAFHKVDLPNHVSLNGFNKGEFKRRLAEAEQDPALMDGCPEWLDQLGQAQLGERWADERAALCQPSRRYLRVNTLKCEDKDTLAHKLKLEGVTTRSVKGVPSALEVISDSALFRTYAFDQGRFEQQDAGSQLIAPWLDVKPGMRVIDACAGAGGKTLHLAALMQGRGRLLAMDVEQWKLDSLKQRARRAGAHNVETRLIEGNRTIKRLKASADRVLLDVPCSGIGVLKRNPDAKWKDTAERLQVLTELQREILASYSRMVKPGGLLVYATCSILPQENRQQIDRFLAEAGDSWKLLEDRVVSPAETGFDGFYMARLERLA